MNTLLNESNIFFILIVSYFLSKWRQAASAAACTIIVLISEAHSLKLIDNSAQRKLNLNTTLTRRRGTEHWFGASGVWNGKKLVKLQTNIHPIESVIKIRNSRQKIGNRSPDLRSKIHVKQDDKLVHFVFVTASMASIDPAMMNVGCCKKWLSSNQVLFKVNMHIIQIHNQWINCCVPFQCTCTYQVWTCNKEPKRRRMCH